MKAPDPIPEFDLYAELDVAFDADSAAIERAWRAGVRSVHPDRALSGDERAATTRTARLNIAREWLMDPTKRARYDLLRRPGTRVVLPEVDPLGPWPARPRPPRSYFLTALMQIVVTSLVVLAISVTVGIGTNVLTALAFGISLVIFVFFGLCALVWVLVGVLTRRLNS